MAIKTYDFDTLYDRSNTQSSKWERFPDAIPLSTAEMEFPVAPEVLDALHQRVEHGFFGYTDPADELRDLIVQRMKTFHNWDIQPESIVFNPGMIVMLNVVTQIVGQPGDGVLMHMPAYGPFLTVPGNRQRFPQMVDMLRVDDDASTFRYEIDFDAFADAITPQTALYYLCNPHNPAGKVLTRHELERLAEICLKHNIIIASDEIHCEIRLDETPHIPIATLAPEIADKTITMISHTKAFNMAGLPCSAAIIPNEELRTKIEAKNRASGYHCAALAYTAMTAAFRDGDDWLRAALQYIRANRDYTVQFVRDDLPMLKTTVPQATYMAWLDASALAVPEGYENLQDFFVKEAKVVLNPGTFFGAHFGDYLRLNFACPRPMLEDALQRMKAAVGNIGEK